MRDLAEACEELLAQLEVFAASSSDEDRADAGLVLATALIAEADTDPGMRRSGRQESRPPWNSKVADAYMDTHQAVRRLEASLRIVVAGHPGRARGGSDANTTEAIRAISRMATAASVIHTGIPVSRREPEGRKMTAAELAARVLDRLTRVIGQLPAVDEFPKWEKIRNGPDGLPPRCPNCETFSLRVAVQSGIVCCFLPGCADLDGNSPPQARLDMSKLNGEPVLAWADGTVQAAPRLRGPIPPVGTTALRAELHFLAGQDDSLIWFLRVADREPAPLNVAVAALRAFFPEHHAALTVMLQCPTASTLNLSVAAIRAGLISLSFQAGRAVCRTCTPHRPGPVRGAR